MDLSAEVLLGLVALFWASSAVGQQSPDSRKCCLPQEFVSVLGTHGGIPSGGVPDVYDVEFRFAYDYPNKRWGIWNRFIYVTQSYTEWMYIEDYKTRQVMQVTGRTNIVMDMPDSFVDMREYCIPDDAEFTGTNRVGYGEESYAYDSYEWDLEYPGDLSAHFKAGFLPDCTPINELAWFRDYNFNYTTYVNFFEVMDLDDEWNPFQQYDKYWKLNRSHRKEWPSIEEDAQRPHHMNELHHLLKRLHVLEGLREDQMEQPEGEDYSAEDEAFFRGSSS